MRKGCKCQRLSNLVFLFLQDVLQVVLDDELGSEVLSLVAGH
jgi:hypothetical protein